MDRRDGRSPAHSGEFALASVWLTATGVCAPGGITKEINKIRANFNTKVVGSASSRTTRACLFVCRDIGVHYAKDSCVSNSESDGEGCSQSSNKIIISQYD